MIIDKKNYLFNKFLLGLNILLIAYCFALTLKTRILASNYLDLSSCIGRLYASDCKDIGQTRRWLESRTNETNNIYLFAWIINSSVDICFNRKVLDSFNKNVIWRSEGGKGRSGSADKNRSKVEDERVSR